MKTIELLKPLPIRRDEQRHQYVNIETGQWFSYSTTGVCNELTECLAEKMLGNKKIDFKEYGSWVEPLLQHDLFTHFEPMAVEHMMAIPDKSVGGQLDLLGRDTKTGQVRLIDLKTKKSCDYFMRKRKKDGLLYIEDLDRYWQEPYSTDKQLGCYVEMLKLNYDITPDVCNTIWAFEGRCILNNDQPVERCTEAWQEAWKKFEAREELF